MSFEDADDVAPARSPRSTSITARPRPAASRAIPTPFIPPPTTNRSSMGAAEELGNSGTLQDRPPQSIGAVPACRVLQARREGPARSCALGRDASPHIFYKSYLSVMTPPERPPRQFDFSYIAPRATHISSRHTERDRHAGISAALSAGVRHYGAQSRARRLASGGLAAK